MTAAAVLYWWHHGGLKEVKSEAIMRSLEKATANMDPTDDEKVTERAKLVMKRLEQERAGNRYASDRSDKDLQEDLVFWKKRIRIEWTLCRRALVLAKEHGYPATAIQATWSEMGSDGFWMEADDERGRRVEDKVILRILDRHAGSPDAQRRIEALGK